MNRDAGPLFLLRAERSFLQVHPTDPRVPFHVHASDYHLGLICQLDLQRVEGVAAQLQVVLTGQGINHVQQVGLAIAIGGRQDCNRGIRTSDREVIIEATEETPHLQLD